MQRGLRCMASGPFMGLPFPFQIPHPLPVPPGGTGDGLSALVDGDVLHRDLLFTAGLITFQRLHLRRERPRQLVEGVRGAVLLREGLGGCGDLGTGKRQRGGICFEEL